MTLWQTLRDHLAGAPNDIITLWFEETNPMTGTVEHLNESVFAITVALRLNAEDPPESSSMVRAIVDLSKAYCWMCAPSVLASGHRRAMAANAEAGLSDADLKDLGL